MKIPALISIVLLILSGCYQQPGVAEVYSWSPPSDDELKLRRFRQNELDEITAQMEKQIFANEDMALGIEVMQESIRHAEAELIRLEAEGAAKIAAMEEKFKKLEMSALELENSKVVIEEGIWKVKQDKLNRELSKKYYAAAVQFFKDGNYDSSIASFRKALSLNPPGSLVDKMHFGISSAYFKMKKYQKAVNGLDVIVSRIPKSDKWFISSVLLGWIYNHLGEKSKAIFVLENATQKKPPEAVLLLLNRLMQVVQEETQSATEPSNSQASKKDAN